MLNVDEQYEMAQRARNKPRAPVRSLLPGAGSGAGSGWCCNSAQLKRWTLKALNFLYDLFALTISVVDVVSDILIAIEFYDRDDKTFFWIAIAIFVVAQISYTVLFLVMYTDGFESYHNRNRTCFSKPGHRRTAWFLLVLPVAQAVPLFVWLESFQFGWMVRFMNWCGLDVKPPTRATNDPLMDYIKLKTRTHGGFIVESITESVPQSILQMIAIVVSGEVTPISVFSISVSILSVATKGLMLSYSVHWPTFFFNFMCFVADVVMTFCNVAWLFYVWGDDQDTGFHSFFLLKQKVSWFSLVWFWREVIVVGTIAVFLAIGFALLLADETARYRRRNRDRRSLVGSTLWVLGVAMFACVVLGPILIVMEAMTLSLLPLLVFHSVGSNHTQYPMFWRALFGWLGDDAEGPFKHKLWHVNYLIADAVVRTFQHSNPAHLHPSTQRLLRTAQSVRRLDEHSYRLRDVRELAGLTFKQFLSSYLSAMKGFNEDYYAANPGARCPPLKTVLTNAGFFWFIYVCAPVCMLASLYSLLMPLIAVCATPFDEITSLHHVLTWTYLALLAGLLVLLPSVIAFRRIVIHVLTYGYRPDSWPSFEEIRAGFHERLCRPREENVARLAVMVANLRINGSNPLAGFMRGFLPDILRLGHLDTREDTQLDMAKLEQHRVVAQLAQEPLPERLREPRRKLVLGGDDSDDSDDDSDDGGAGDGNLFLSPFDNVSGLPPMPPARHQVHVPGANAVTQTGYNPEEEAKMFGGMAGAPRDGGVSGPLDLGGMFEQGPKWRRAWRELGFKEVGGLTQMLQRQLVVGAWERQMVLWSKDAEALQRQARTARATAKVEERRRRAHAAEEAAEYEMRTQIVRLRRSDSDPVVLERAVFQPTDERRVNALMDLRMRQMREQRWLNPPDRLTITRSRTLTPPNPVPWHDGLDHDQDHEQQGVVAGVPQIGVERDARPPRIEDVLDLGPEDGDLGIPVLRRAISRSLSALVGQQEAAVVDDMGNGGDDGDADIEPGMVQAEDADANADDVHADGVLLADDVGDRGLHDDGDDGGDENPE